MALPGPCRPLYAAPCGELALCLVFEPPLDMGWPGADVSEAISGAKVGWAVGGGGPLKFRVDVSVSHDFTTGVVAREGLGVIGEEVTAGGSEAWGADEDETVHGRGGSMDGVAGHVYVYSARYVRWRVTGLAKGVYYHLRVAAWNGIG